MTKLPPGLSAKDFDAATREIRKVTGDEWVFTSEEDVNLYRDAYSPFYGEEEEYVPSGAAAPSSVEEVQAIVKIANRYKLPLWPVSTGRNLGYGGAAPRMTGTMVLDLKRMNKVLEVNDDLAYTLVEPGVSYFDFYRYLKDNNHKVWMDCPDPGWGSLIGNALDHGLGHTAARDHFDHHCGMEIVLPTGELMRTGMGAMPNNPAWNTYKYGFGPHISPIFGQANFGIVTKMGLWLYPEQEEARSYVINIAKNAELEQFLPIMNHLLNSEVFNSSWQLVSPILSSQEPDIKAAASKGDEAEAERLGNAKGLPFWSTRIRLYGAPELNDARWAYIQKRLSAIPSFSFKPGTVFKFPMQDGMKEVPDEADDMFNKGGLGIPSLGIFTVLGRYRSAGHIFFAPIIPLDAAVFRKARAVFRQAGLDIGIPSLAGAAGWCWHKRSIILLYSLGITHDPETNKKMRANYHKLIALAAEHGWSEYRCAPMVMDDVMNAFSFNNGALLKFHETIKDAVDPNGILAPGKSGIWPKRFRGKK